MKSKKNIRKRNRKFTKRGGGVDIIDLTSFNYDFTKVNNQSIL
jgi:hypothetical protein